MKHTVKLLTLLLFISLAGCASNSDVDALRAEVQQATVTANKAMQTANAAKAEARSASETAQEAKATADTTENKIEYLIKKNQTPKHK
jgi:outer membrane murein-binding lipoprotein Lpp